MSTTTLEPELLTVDAAELRSHRQFHLAVLGLSLGVIALSVSLNTVNARQVALPYLEHYPLPEICQSKRLLNLDCPGCGLTRSFIHFFHGRWEASLAMHRFGWLLAVLTIVQIPYRLAALATPNGQPLGIIFPKAIGYGLLALLAVNWLLKLAGV